MKKKAILLILLCTYFYKISAQNNESISQKGKIDINIDRLTAFGYASLKTGADKKTLQPISNVTDASAFLDSVYHKFQTKITQANPSIGSWLDRYYGKDTSIKNNTVIVFIQHSVDLNKLFGDTTKIKKISSLYHTTCGDEKDNIAKLNDLIKLKSTYMQIDEKNLKAYTDLLELISIENNTINEQSRQLDSLQKSYEDYKGQFAESKSIDEFFLNREKLKGKEDWSNYDLEKKNILVVVLGGTDDLLNYKIKIVNGQTYLQSGLSGLQSLAADLGINVAKDFGNCTAASKKPTTMPLTFILLNQDQIKAPSTIKFNDSKDSTKYSFKIHEKTYWGIKVGLSFSQLDRQDFTLNSSNQVTVKLDSVQQKQIKTNLAAMIEFYPFGKDYDRLQPIWASKQETSFGDRIGLVAGIKIAKDPLQDIYAGGSIALSQDYSISFGVQFHSQPKTETNLPVGINTTPDYLKANLSREYKTIFFLNLSMDPAAVAKLLGFKK